MSDEEKKKVEHIVVGFRGRFFACNQGVDISIRQLERRRDKRETERKEKELIRSNNFMRVLVLSLQGIREKEQ